MKLKRTIILTIFLLAILAIGAASAADDNATSETLKLSEDSSESVLSEEIIFTFGNFTALYNDINSGDEIELSSNYKYDNEKDRNLSSGINISTGKHIDGKGLTIDASNGAPIFNINGNGTLLKNIIFKNGANSAIRINNYCTIINCTFINCSGTDGGAISVAQYGSCNIAEGTFINCSATDKGGAIYIDGAYSRVSNSYFENCFASADGGAIYWNGNEGSILNSTFTGSKVGIGVRFGGAIHWAGKNGIIKDSKFNNVTADDNGGAIYWTGENGIVTDCTFTNTNANLNGGAIYWEGDDGIIKNSIFNNTNASSSGGAIRLEGYNGNVTGCTFNNTNSINDGGAIYIGTEDAFIANSTFTNTNTKASGGAIYFDNGETGIIFNCTFTNTNAKSDGGAIRSLRYVSSQIIDSYFVNCSAGDAGGAIFLQGDDGIIENSAFENCSSNTTGGAIHLAGSNGNVTGCTFTNTNAKSDGGAIHLEGDNGILTDCTFNNTAGSQGGAISGEGTDVNITDSTFENTISSYGGAIHLDGNNGNVTNCTFNNINAYYRAGAICWRGNNGAVTDSTFTNTKVINGDGGAIYWFGENGNITNSKFNNITATNGGAIYWYGENGTVTDSTFTNTNAESLIDGGGAIYWYGENGIVTNSRFNNTTAQNGGAIHIRPKITELFNCTFHNSSAKENGGAIYSFQSESNLISNLYFANCSATEHGGAIHLYKNVNAIVTNSTFENCSATTYYGGAIYFEENVNARVASSKFNNITAKTGGAIYMECTGTGALTDSTFTNTHSNVCGGAIYMYITDAAVINCTFSNSSSDDGGAIYAFTNELIIADSFFRNCSAASSGGAVYEEPISSYSTISGGIVTSSFRDCFAVCQGGAIYWNGNEGNLQNSVFTRSKAKNGGAVYWAGKNGLIKDSTFNNTSANSTEDNSGGGAIYWTGENGIVTDCTFTNTSANSTGKDSGGGAIYWTGENAKVTNSTFTNTNANGTSPYGVSGGGGIYMHKNNTGIIFNCTFNNSTSEDRAGAIYSERDLFIISESYFINCFAITGGAVVVSDSSTTGSITNSYFINCSSGSMGGAIYWEGDNGNVTDSAFINTKGTMGGAICWDGDNGKVIGSLFDNTTNDWEGGAIFWRGSNGNVTHSTFYNTNSISGGAIYWEGTDGSIQYSTFISSKAQIGGAVYSEAQDTLITFSHFENNTDDGEGSAVYLGIVSNCTFVGNTPPTLYPKTILNTTITATNSTCYIGGEIEITPIRITIDNMLMVGGEFDLYVNGKFNKTIQGENSKFTFTPKEAGEYRLQIKINATAQFYASESNVLNITSLKKDPAMTVSCDDITYGDEASIIVTLKNDTTGNITFEIDNRTYSCKVNDGSCNLNINGLNAGTYNVTVTYSGDAVYKNATCHDTLTVQKAEASILTDPINSTYYGEDVIITVILPNDATGTVTVTVDGTNYNATITSRRATFNIAGLNAGNYVATIKYAGDDNYMATQDTAQFSINKIDTEISVASNSLDLKVLEEVAAGASLTPDNAGQLTYTSSNGNIAFVENGKIKAVGAGTATITVSFAGNDNYAAAESKSIEVTVTLKDTNIIAEDMNLILGDTHGITYATTPNGLNVTFTADNSGVVSVSTDGVVTTLKAGVGKITLSVGGDNIYALSSTDITVNVRKADVVMTISTNNIIYGENAIITATMSIDGTLTVNINNQNIDLEITNGTGQIAVPNLPAGTYIANAQFAGNSNYNPANATTTITVGKKTPTITATATVTEQNVLITVTTPNDATGTVTATVAGTNYNANINNATATFNLKNMNPGTYPATITYNGNNNYNTAQTNTSFTINKKTPTITATATVTGQNVLITVTVPNDATGTVTATVAGTNYNANINNGKATFNLTNMNPGTYPATITYNGNNNYNSVQTNTSFTINKKTPTVTATATVTGQNVLITVTVPNDATGTVTAIVDGKNYNANIINGKATFNLTNMNPGTYDATVSYPGDNNYLAAQNTTSFTVKSSKKTFADITSLINSASAGDVINLAGTYYGSGSIINVNKAVSIVGSENTVLDAGGLSGIMTVSSNNVKISNIKFVNGRLNSNGGAINWIGSNGILSNCTFENCSANNGGAVYWNSNDGQILNSKFINSRAKSGGAVYVSGNNEVVAASSIFKNNAEILNAPAYGSKLSNCAFESCSADNGGSVYWNAKNGVIEETSFANSQASSNGGSVYWNANDGQILNSKFTNSRAKNGGAVYVSGNNNVIIESSSFQNNNAEVLNGAVYGGKTKQCSFVNNTDSQTNTRTIVTLNETAVFIGNSISITTLVLNQQKGGLARGTVNLYINSELVATIDANDGFIYTPPEIGTYEVTAVFNENTEHHNSSDTVTFSAIPIEIPEEISTSTAGVFTLEFPSDAEGALKVFIDGTEYKVYDIVGGILKIDLTQFKGKHVITFEYSGDDNYPAFKKDVNVTVKTNPSITASNVNVQYLAKQKYTIKVLKNKGIAAASTWVVIKLNNKAFKKLKTNKNGIVTFVVTQNPGTYKLKITALGKTVQRTVKVRHIVALKTATLKKSARKITLQATLAKVKGKYLIKKSVIFKINGKKVATAKTNKKGVAKITIRNPNWLKKLKVGKKVTYQATYLKDTVKKTTKIKR